jgi:glycosyltransferase involved in cell wall biosynthesis
MYLASGRPILYLSLDEPASDPTLRLLRRFPGVVVAPNETSAIAAALENVRKHFHEISDASRKRPYMTELDEFEWGSLSERFVQVISDLT